MTPGRIMPALTRLDLVKRYGPTALVTGASDGIGQAIALRLAEAGIDLILVARRKTSLEQLATEIQATFAVQVMVVTADMATDGGVERTISACENQDIGLLVAAAGYGTSGPFIAARLEDELTMIDVNCRAVAALAHHFGRRFAARRRGGLVLMSSLVAFQGVPRAANYAATKAYIQSLAEGLRQELAPHGVDVLASAPGPIHSGFADRAGMRMGFAQTPDVVALATLQALGRRGTVRPGWLAKALEASLALLPRWGRVRIMALVMNGMTRHQHDQNIAQIGKSA